MKKVTIVVFGTLLLASPALAQESQSADQLMFFFGAPIGNFPHRIT